MATKGNFVTLYTHIIRKTGSGAFEFLSRFGVSLLGRMCLSLLFAPCLLIPALAAEADGTDSTAQELVTQYWHARGKSEEKTKAKLVSAANKDISMLYRWLSAGPIYKETAPLGVNRAVRTDRGTRYQYIYVVPNNYDHEKSYPVEFMLHGGIDRPPPRGSGGKWWRDGKHYEDYSKLEKISVFPSSWADAPWWSKEQSENLLEILVALKKTYNIDDNRVYLSGVSDGGTGTFYSAFTKPTEWATFHSYIGHPEVLITLKAIRGDNFDFENLKNSSFYIVNGTDDLLYSVEKIRPYINIFKTADVDYQFRAIEGGQHNLKWFRDELPSIEAHQASKVRDPQPDLLRWSTDDVRNYGRIHWLRIDKLKKRKTPGWISTKIINNDFHVYTLEVKKFSLLLHPEEVDFSRPIRVQVNDEIVFESIVSQSIDTLFEWAEQRDKTQLFTAELIIDLSKLKSKIP